MREPQSIRIEENEQLSRELTSRQLSMIALGGAIGTGLFLGSSLAVHTAGPGVIVSYLLGAAIAILLMRALSEMAVAHPTAGSFGVYAGIYLNPWAGFAVRYTYWAAQCVAIGGEAAAIAIYCQWWFPDTPKWLWILGFTVALLYVNARSVGSFGSFEYWFAMIKVVAIVLFILFGLALIVGAKSGHGVGFSNLTAHGGFLANGWSGIWMAMVFVIFSYIGTEVVAVTAGEAKDPDIALPKAIRTMAARLILFYLCAIVVLLSIVPWNQIQPGADVTASPFVRVFQFVGVPAAAHVVNFVVITAAASSMNCNFYLVSRMMFSLARSGYAPASWGRVSGVGTPFRALLISACGLALAIVIAFFFPDSVFVYMFGISLFGGLFTWLAIFVTHWFFRRKRGMAPDYGSLLGAAAVFAILITTWAVPGMRVTLIAGLPWIVLLTVCYFLLSKRQQARV
ncbi:MAG TPA: amino acid permease [Bryobacteraceae bacterium]|jgi:L-asparagine transporter-like permease|nr:amino acid permease [Bryobacteraceae bacterium]